MRFKRDLKPLLRINEQSLFKWKKDGVYQLIRGNYINIELEDIDYVIEGLTNMLDYELTHTQRVDIEEVIKYLKAK